MWGEVLGEAGREEEKRGAREGTRSQEQAHHRPRECMGTKEAITKMAELYRRSCGGREEKPRP